ncbi:OmpA family protein [Inhella gelatinilytica]|uniref:OmpA family protein n=1 Tax=Inhella gelatinilytica TaxID=2795030 RepID=A0A931IW71_9BURK|nr:OmpA family protein [Inhella gelatinilytica]MBH9552135.1 OmpA family protein [Inhella gelatinilytica]
MKTQTLIGCCLLSFNPLWASAADNPKCAPDPVFERHPRGELSTCEKASFKALTLTSAYNTSSGERTTVAKEGAYWASFYSIRKDASGALPSTLELQRNYENAVRQGNGKVVWRDASPSSMGDLTFQLSKGGTEYWGKVYCDDGNSDGCGRLVIETVGIKAMSQEVTLSAEQIAKDMKSGGKVIFYGILFDTDKSSIKPESEPTLVEMAKWLKTNPAARVFIVGHTDMQGQSDYNVRLSKDRAGSVVSALTGRLGIAKERLAAEGVGPLAPVASNGDEAGRARNRRVEMVIR